MSLSLMGREWVFRNISEEGSLVSRILAARNLSDDFVKPSLRGLFPDPWSFMNMKAFCESLVDAISNSQCVGVFGDYDVDGACASAILSETLVKTGLEVLTHIPDRILEGYGPNKNAIQSLIDRGASVIVCVDCGSLSSDVFADVLRDNPDVKILVLDHHVSHVPSQNCIAVNPNSPGCESGMTFVCAGFLALVAVVGLRRICHERGVAFPVKPDDFLDLAGLSTVCDVMPLIGVNRAVVRSGLKKMRSGSRPGIAALVSASGIRDEDISSFSLGFALGPRINAGGRIGDATAGLRLLRMSDPDEALKLASELSAVNVKRKSIGEDILNEAMVDAEAQIRAGAGVLVVARPDWHVGIVGIVAGRLREAFNRPSLVAGGVEDAQGSNVLKGSARSVKGFDLGGAIIRARSEGILLSGGGHQMAAGFSLEPGKVEALVEFFSSNWPELSQRPIQEDLSVDCFALRRDLSVEEIQSVLELQPFGNGFETPIFVIPNVRINNIRNVGADEQTVLIECAVEGMFLKAVAFKAAESAMIAGVKEHDGDRFDLAGELSVNVWKGRSSVEMIVRDIRVSSVS